MKVAKNKILSPFAIIVATICLSLVGWALLPLLSVKLIPSSSGQSLSVSFNMGGATSQVIESKITSRLEGALSRISNIEKITSRSDNGYGLVQVVLNQKADMEVARFEASSIVRQLWNDLPNGVSYPAVSLNVQHPISSKSFMVYSIYASEPASEIKRTVGELFESGFSDIKGLSDIEITGSESLEWRIIYDACQLNELGITQEQIREALLGRCRKATIGHTTVITDGDSEGLDVRDIYIMAGDSSFIALDKLVKIEHKEVNPDTYYRINGQNLVYLRFSASEDANQLSLAERIEERIITLKSKLPNSYQLHRTYDATEHISKELNKIYLRSSISIALLLLFVFLTSFSIKYVFTVAIGIIFNVSIALVFYYWFDVEFQIFSLAALTISLNMIIDNIIVVVEHWKRKRNVQVILPVLAATLTTIGSLFVFFFLDKETQQNMWFFVVVLVINLLVSLAIAMIVVPAILNMIPLNQERDDIIRKSHMRRVVRLRQVYKQYIVFAVRKKRWIVSITVLLFGLPVFMMPKALEDDMPFSSLYNNTFGADIYRERIKPIVDVVFGGVLRLFVEEVSTSDYWSRNDEVVLSVVANMPYGSTIEAMDRHVRKMESFLSKYNEISQFETIIENSRVARIDVRFMDQYAHTEFPYKLKRAIVSKSLQLGAGSWKVYGLRDKSFSNDTRETSGSYMVRLSGYNYADLLVIADSVSNRLKENSRIKEVEIKPNYSWYKDDYVEYVFLLDKEALAVKGMTPSDLFYAIDPLFVKNSYCGTVWSGNSSEQIVMTSLQANVYDLWQLENMLIFYKGMSFRLNELCTIEKRQAPLSIEKENQQYKLCLQYEYFGSNKIGTRYLNKVVNEFEKRLPKGYEIKRDLIDNSSDEKNNNYFMLVVFVIIVVVFITSILFNSVRYSFVVLSLLPVSFIGAFLTYYIFDVHFDLGGVAAMILLCGITINSAIYIINEYKCQQKSICKISQIRKYLKAFDVKIVAIILTIISTVLGFVPFVLETEHDPFWYSLSVGIIGGLLFSVLGLFFYLPMFCISQKTILRK